MNLGELNYTPIFILIEAALYVRAAGICFVFLREKVSHYILALITGGLSSIDQSEVWEDIWKMLFHPKNVNICILCSTRARHIYHEIRSRAI